MGSSFKDAKHLLAIIKNLNLGVGHPKIVNFVDNEPVYSNQGIQEYKISINNNYLDVVETLEALNEKATSEEKIKFLAGLVGVTIDKIEEILSGFTRMKNMRTQLFDGWYVNGRPDSYIFRTFPEE